MRTDALTPGQIIRALAPGQFAGLGKAAVAGSLEARRLSSGAVVFYWRVTHKGKALRELIGQYDSGAPPKSLEPTSKGYSVAAAFEAAKVLAQAHLENIEAGGFAAFKAAEAEARERQKAEAEAARAAQEAMGALSLEALMDEYADHLEAMGRQAHKDVRSITKLHIVKAWPEVAALPANQVDSERIADMMRALIEAGKGRTANKLRSYIRAAYQTAKAAKSKPSIPVSFKLYGVRHNPAAETAPDERQNRADKNPLRFDDMCTYWHAIKDRHDFKGAVLRLHLLTGGQRIEQLVSLKTANVTDKAITLYDSKGRPGKDPRPHALPLLPEAAAALSLLKPAGEYAISTDGGKTHLAATTLSEWAKEAAKEAGLDGFQAKRIRSGVETLLAELGVSQEVRGRLQSHGISGVQSVHYNGYEYMKQKQAALAKLRAALDRKPSSAKVVPLHPAKAAA